MDPAADLPTAPPRAEPVTADAPLTVAAVAHRLGVAPATLRTWDRRYGLGPSAHAAGSHRRYGPLDVVRLQTMRRLTLQGVAPADAARVALSAESGAVAAPLPDREGRLAPVPAAGGRVLALPGADAAVRGLGRAAMALDAAAVTGALREALDEHGVVETWDHVLRPVLVAVGDRWAATGEGVEVEHLLSDCAGAVLREVAERARAAGPPASPRPVLLCCAPDDWHALPVAALAAALAARRVDVRVLGASLPGDALTAAVRRTGPALLFLWSQLRETARPDVLDALPTTRPPTALVVGGPGWDGVELSDRVTRATDLKSAVALVEQALGI